MTATVYSDASFCYKTDVAACGFCAIVEGKLIKHQVQLVANLGTPAICEIFALTEAIQFAFLIPGVTKIVAFTDYEPILTRKKTRSKYEDLDITIEICRESGISVSICHVKGHSGDKYNTIVDKSCNKSLKKYLHGDKETKKRKTSFGFSFHNHPLRRNGKGIPIPKQ